MISTKKILSVIWDYVVVSLGTLLFCMGWETFLIPNGIAAGGLTGACTVLQFATHGLIPVAYSTFIANALLLIVGVIVLGNAFGIKTVYVVVLSSIFFKILPTFRRGGSTGGTDIIALVMNKFWPLSPGKVYLYSDVFIIASVLLIPGKTFEDMIYGYIAMITFSFMLDFVLLGSKSTVQVLVFTQKYEQMADYIMKNMRRGVTVLKAVGWYTRTEKNVLLILVRKSQMPELSKVIKAIDDKAFVSVSPASSVYGEGFDELKTGIPKKAKLNQPEQQNTPAGNAQ